MIGDAFKSCVVIVLLAGCLGAPSAPSGAAMAAPAPGMAEPYPLAFAKPVTVAQAPAVPMLPSLGEPSIATTPDGTLFVTATACDQGMPHLGLQEVDRCRHPPVWRSQDDGFTWSLLNKGADRRLSDDGPTMTADAVVRADLAGNLYLTALGPDGVGLLRSQDNGDSWDFLGEHGTAGADRQFMAVRDHRILMTWREGDHLLVQASQDAGVSWDGPHVIVEDMYNHGQPAIGAEGQVYVPVVRTDMRRVEVAIAGWDVAEWRFVDVGASLPPARAGIERTPTWVAPAPLSFVNAAVALDGSIGIVWDQEGTGTATRQARGHTKALFTASRDGGATWSPPLEVGDGSSSMLMPWIVAAPNQGFWVVSFRSTILGDSDYVGNWDVEAARLGHKADGWFQERVMVEQQVHFGGLCTDGTNCTLRGADRSIMDLFEATLAVDGRLHVTYTSDPLLEGKPIRIRTAHQA